MSERPVSVTVFHNVSRDASFGLNSVWRSGPEAPAGRRAYQDEKTGTWSWKGRAETAAERHELVRVFEYAADPEDVENDSVLERAFEVFNVGEGPVAQRYRANRLRSLSVGDVLRVTDGDSDEYWSCESCGWQKRDRDELRVVTVAQGAALVRERYAPWGKSEPLSVTVPLTGGTYSSRANRPEQAPVTQVAPNVVVVRPDYLGEYLDQVTGGWPSFASQGKVDCDGQSYEGEY